MWRRVSGALLLCLAAGCGGDEATGPVEPTPMPPWLEVGWLAREPRLPPPDSLAPPDTGWPEPGATVTWVAHVLNRGDDPADQVRFRWLLDGVVADSGRVDLPPGDTEVRWRWPWTFDRHEISFRIDPGTAIDARLEDDSATVVSNALSVGFWIHRSIYAWMLLSDHHGFERQAQKWLVDWNALLARDSWPSSPQGVLDRLRLDRVVVLPDGAAYPTDVDTDLVWFFRTGSTDPRFLNVGSTEAQRTDETIVLHELLHQRGAVDLYAYEVQHDSPNGSHVGIVENGELVAGTPAMPLLSDGVTVFKPTLDGLMGRLIYLPDARITEHTAYSLNLHAGLRTPRWNDATGQHDGFAHGWYANWIPDTTLVRLLTTSGEPVANAHVEIFLDHDTFFYQDLYLAGPDREVDADEDGVFRLPADILDGTYTIDVEPKSWTLILRVTTLQGRRYVFLPGYELNLPYFRGATELGRIDLDTGFP